MKIPPSPVALAACACVLWFGAGCRAQEHRPNPRGPAERSERSEPRPFADSRRDPRPDQAERFEAEQRHRAENRERLAAQFDRARASGNDAEADEIRAQLRRLDARPDGHRAPRVLAPGQRGRSGRPLDPYRAEDQPLQDRPGANEDNRMRHLMMAAEHLHAAGLGDLAHEVERRANELRPQPRPHANPESFQRLQAEINELRAQVRELQRHIRARPRAEDASPPREP